MQDRERFGGAGGIRALDARAPLASAARAEGYLEGDIFPCEISFH